LVAIALTLPAAARADTPDDADLELHELPPPDATSLRMRAAQADDGLDDDPFAGEALDPEADIANDDDDAARQTREDDDERDLLVPRAQRTLEENVIFRFNLGWGLDGGQATETRQLLSGAQLNSDDYSSLRIYTFGDAVVGSRGLGTASLSTYLAAHFYFDQDGGRPSQAVPSVYDNDRVGNVQVRTAYAETDGMFDNRWLNPLFIRAGRQYRYGPAIAHYDGLTIGYETRAFSFTTYGGTRVPLFPLVLEDSDTGNLVFSDPRDTMSGWDARINLWEIKRVPLVITGSLLRFRKRTHFDGGLIIRWSPDILIRSNLRILGNDFARETLNIRARISDTTTINAILENRTGDDWIYDLLFTDQVTDVNDPRKYLNVGLPLPRLYAGLRGGTVFFDNIDVTFRGGIAAEHSADSSTFSSSYWEGGGAAEVRVRRTLAVGASALIRSYDRDELTALDTSSMPDPISATTGQYGEESFLEAGGTLRFSEGARKFSASAEAYGRAYRFPRPDVPSADGDGDLVLGGRFSVEGWAGENLRLKAEYDVSGQIARSPELRGLKSLRVLAEGRF
jgi:hypothetical protein